MKKEEIVKIGKELILLAGTKSKKDKQKLEELFDSYEAKLSKDSTKYSKIVLGFIHDLRDDLKAGRELNIDSIDSDTYVENYFITKNEVVIYNGLIDKELYRNFFSEGTKNHSELINKLSKNFESKLKKLSSKNIAKNLLIFTLFNTKKPLEALSRMNLYAASNLKDKELAIKINLLSNLYIGFKEQVLEEGVNFYKKGNFNYKYIKFSNDNIDSKSSDASKSGFRMGNPKFEYKQLLKALK